MIYVQQLLDTLLSVLAGLGAFFQLGAASNLGCFENTKSWFQKAALAIGVRGDPCFDNKRVTDTVLETFQTHSGQIETETGRHSTSPPGDATDEDNFLELFGLAYAEALRIVCSPNEKPDTSNMPTSCSEKPPWQKETDILTDDDVS